MKLRDIPEILNFLPEVLGYSLHDLVLHIDLDADINAPVIRSAHSNTEIPLLHWACQNQMHALIEMLIANHEKYGLNINTLDEKNVPALAYITSCSLMQMFIEAGADLTIPVHEHMITRMPVLPLDRFLPAPGSARMADPTPSFPHNFEFSNIKNVLSALYDRHFYEKDKTKLAITLADTAVNQLGLDSIVPLISEYAFGISNDITDRKCENEVEYLGSMCKKAYEARQQEKFTGELYKAVGAGGLNNLIELANLLGENGIAKLAALLKQPTPSACPGQNAHPAVLSFSRNTSSSSSSSSSSASASASASARKNSSSTTRGINHPRWRKR